VNTRHPTPLSTREPHLNHKGNPKLPYATQAAARAAIPVVTPHQRMREPTAYHCSTCDLWHIGNESLLPEWPLRTPGATIALHTSAPNQDSASRT
jgi:hypothetical protein